MIRKQIKTVSRDVMRVIFVIITDFILLKLYLRVDYLSWIDAQISTILLQQLEVVNPILVFGMITKLIGLWGLEVMIPLALLFILFYIIPKLIRNYILPGGEEKAKFN